MKRREITEFNEAFGYPAPLKPTTEANYKLRAKLIVEELTEYREACKDNDIIEIADAIGDMLYLVLGAAVEHGIEIEPVFNEIHRSNMSKLSKDGKPIRREDGKVLKGPDYFKPDIAKVLNYSLTFNGYKNKIGIEAGVDKYVHTLIDVVANHFDLTVNALCGPSRKQPLPIARHIISYLCFKQYTSYSYFERPLQAVIDRDRTTYIHGNKLVKQVLEVDKGMRLTINEIESKLIKELS